MDSYERRALELARNPAAFAAVRAKLAANRDSCALFDTARFTRNLEAAYAQMWRREQNGEAPASFAADASAGDVPS
jgi:predicted O-linked N-acetylglucosamine transferase (SPINDLY family)